MDNSEKDQWVGPIDSTTPFETKVIVTLHKVADILERIETVLERMRRDAKKGHVVGVDLAEGKDKTVFCIREGGDLD